MQSKQGQRADLRYTDLSGLDFSGVDFTGADFTGADLTGAKFRGSTLTTAIFTDATMTRVDVTSATLDGAILAGLNLCSVIWGTGISAAGAHFEKSVLVGCQIGSSSGIAKLSGAFFTGSDLSGGESHRRQSHHGFSLRRQPERRDARWRKLHSGDTGWIENRPSRDRHLRLHGKRHPHQRQPVWRELYRRDYLRCPNDVEQCGNAGTGRLQQRLSGSHLLRRLEPARRAIRRRLPGGYGFYGCVPQRFSGERDAGLFRWEPASPALSSPTRSLPGRISPTLRCRSRLARSPCATAPRWVCYRLRPRRSQSTTGLLPGSIPPPCSPPLSVRTRACSRRIRSLGLSLTEMLTATGAPTAWLASACLVAPTPPT